jgi:hypothetical protein
MGSKVGTEEIGGTLRTVWKNLSKTPRVTPIQSVKQPTNQTNKTRKNNNGAEVKEEGDIEA